jgi:hypothetical protein
MIKPTVGLQKSWLTQDMINQVPHGELINGGWQMHHPKAEQVIDGVAIDSPLGWIKCPYGWVGDVLWVRETWQKSDVLGFLHKAEYKEIIERWNKKNPDNKWTEKNLKWKPSIFMPKAACRIKLEITDVRVERLQDISEEDAKAEGIEFTGTSELGSPIVWRDYLSNGAKFLHSTNGIRFNSINSYQSLWESINGKAHGEKIHGCGLLVLNYCK